MALPHSHRGLYVRKINLKSGTVVVAAIALLVSGILPSHAATLRVPKTSWAACAVQNGTYCVESVTITTAQGKVVPLQWVNTGVAVPAAQPNNGISFAPVAKVVNGVVKGNGWWMDQYQRDALTSGTAVYMDISTLIGGGKYPEIGAKYDSTTKLFDVTRPQDSFTQVVDCWDPVANNSSKKAFSDCYKGAIAAVNQGEVKFIFNYASPAEAAAAAKDFSTSTWVDLKDLANTQQQPAFNSKYDATAKTFSKTEPLYTPIWVTNNSLVNGWDVAGTPATAPSTGNTVPAASASPDPSASPSATAAAGTAATDVTAATSVPGTDGVAPAPLAPNEQTTVQAPVEAGRALVGRWTTPMWNSLGLGSLGYDGLFVDAKAANEFVNHVMIDVVPTLTGADNKASLAGQPGNKSYAVSLDSDIVISVTVRTGDIHTGVTVAVGVDTTVTTQKMPDFTKLTITGTAVNVPLAKSAADCTGEAGVAKALVRQFQTLIVVQNDTAGFGVDGTTGNMYVGSNGVCSLTTPTWDATNKTFSWTAAAPHFAPDGTTQNLGFYKAVIPFQDAAVLWGLTNPADAATALTVSVTTEAGGSTAAISTVSAKNGNIIIDTSGFGYSKPKLMIKIKKGYKPSAKKISTLPAPKYTITCALGATTKKVVGTAPACPKGYVKVGARR
jgi:hypothetical protein